MMEAISTLYRSDAMLPHEMMDVAVQLSVVRPVTLTARMAVAVALPGLLHLLFLSLFRGLVSQVERWI